MVHVGFRPLLATTVLALGVAAPAAHAAYGPENPQPGGAPGGYTQVVTSRVLGYRGGSLSGAATGAKVTVSVARGEFQGGVQLVVLKPRFGQLASAVHHAGFRRDKVIAGVGLGASQLSGAQVNRFRRPVKLVISTGRRAGHAVVVRYDQRAGRFVRVRFAHANGGRLVVFTKTPGAFAVVVPAAKPHHRARPHRRG